MTKSGPKIKWHVEPSCLTSHPVVSGPASCTSCDPTSCNKHFTIVDPKTNTGTCTKTKCPFCKPKPCCGAGHKHYVLNTDNEEGVCVRHSDDCTPVCVPLGYDGFDKRRVCTKGCNRLLKALKNPNAKTEAEMFNIAVCQAEKKVSCQPATKVQIHGKTKLKAPCVTTASSSEISASDVVPSAAMLEPEVDAVDVAAPPGESPPQSSTPARMVM